MFLLMGSPAVRLNARNLWFRRMPHRSCRKSDLVHRESKSNEAAGWRFGPEGGILYGLVIPRLSIAAAAAGDFK
jgi:hypothetical protein